MVNSEAVKVRVAVPQAALAGLVELYAGRAGEFEGLLRLMVEYAEYFFGESWPEMLGDFSKLEDADLAFVEKGGTYRDKCGRFTLACVKRNMCLKGFNVEGFQGCFNFYGDRECWGCPVRRVMGLRSEIEWKEQFRREIEDEIRTGEPSWIAARMGDHLKKAETVKADRMLQVELRFYEKFANVKGRTCQVGNLFKCPYGEESERLVEDGEEVDVVWRVIVWYDRHWNRSSGYTPPACDLRWYHYDELGIIDVACFEDVLKAVDDGRLDKIIGEYGKYVKETGNTT